MLRIVQVRIFNVNHIKGGKLVGAVVGVLSDFNQYLQRVDIRQNETETQYDLAYDTKNTMHEVERSVFHILLIRWLFLSVFSTWWKITWSSDRAKLFVLFRTLSELWSQPQQGFTPRQETNSHIFAYVTSAIGVRLVYQHAKHV